MNPLTVYIGNALDILQGLPAESVHCVVTSPPYYGLRDYNTPEVAFPAGSFVPMAGMPAMEFPAWTGHLGLEPDPQMFVGHMVQIFKEVRRVLRSDGSLWMNFGDSYASSGGAHGGRDDNQRGVGSKRVHDAGAGDKDNRRPPDGLKPKDLTGMPWRVAFALQASGWYLRSDIIWHKRNPMPESVTDRPTKAHEYVFLLTKSTRYYYDAVAIKEPVSGTAHPRGTGVNPKAKTPGKNSRIHVAHCGAAPQARQNASFSAAVAGLVETRNKRTVWSVATAPYKEAHFATYPPDLIRPCILAGTSEKGCCAMCGTPWQRKTEKRPTGKTQKMPDGMATHDGGHGSIHKDGREKGQTGNPVMASVTLGWEPLCKCYFPWVPRDLYPTVPAVVLDPFGGSGTTGQVALEHGRRAVLIELGQHHADLIQRRCAPALTPAISHIDPQPLLFP